jgi:DNA-directed RNA polymerase subunit M/transcription elongation factor TFIIS
MNKPTECPNCGHDNFTFFQRTRQGLEYSVFVCTRCHNIVRREINNVDSNLRNDDINSRK